MNTSSLPLKQNISTTYTFSLITAFLMIVVSIAGLFFSSSMYPIEEVQHSSVATDVVNLFIVFPVLIGSMLLAQRGKLLGLLFWPGRCSLSLITTWHMQLP